MKIDRLLAILHILSELPRVTAPELAGRLEVSRRTINRDIEVLCQAGFPIVTQQGSNGGISLPEGYRLDKSPLKREEWKTILAGIKGLSTVDQSAATKELLKRLTGSQELSGNQGDFIRIDLASYYKDSLSPKIALLRQAVNENRLVTFRYYSGNGIRSRIVEPYYVIYQWSSWYLCAYCREKEAYRLFKLNRLWALSLLEQHYEVRTGLPEHENSIGYMTDENPVTVLIHPEAEYILVEEYGPDCYTRAENGWLLYHGGYTNRDYMIRWLLGFGEQAKVIAPPDLKHEIIEKLQKMQEAYRT